MKKLILSLSVLCLSGIATYAQVPRLFNYQGVARNASGTPIASHPIGLRITIHDSTTSGPVLYQETQNVTTNTFGLYTAQIGNGSVVTGSINSISWGNGLKYMQVEIDPSGGTSYTDAGTSQLLSVPYSLYSHAATIAGAADTIVGPLNLGGDLTGPYNAANVTKLRGHSVSGTAPTSGQVLEWDGTAWTPTDLSGGGTGTVTSVTAGSGLSGGTITTSGTISMPDVGTPGTYGSATQIPVFSTDAQGRVTSVTNTTLSAGTVTSVTAGTGLSGGTITTSGTISLPNVGTSGTYGDATHVPMITTDAQGRVSSVTNTAITVPTVSGDANYVAKFTGTSAIGDGLLYDNGTSVGLGTTSPAASATLNVISSPTEDASTTYFAAGVVASTTTSDGTDGSGVYGESEWRGVYGHNSASSATGSPYEAIGVQGSLSTGSNYTEGYGVKGVANAYGPNNFGVYGSASNGTSQNIGVYGSGTSAGVYGYGDAIGTYGQAYGSGTTYTSALVIPLTSGVTGEAFDDVSGRPIGVFAHAASTLGDASASGGQTGLLAEGENAVYNFGIEAYTNNNPGSGTDYAIYCQTDGTASSSYAGYFAGDIYANSASSSIKAFKIDDPRDPENKYLYHSSVESNDMMDLYNGNVVTDANGDAIVTLPSYFSVLNKDFKYQLTVIGQFAQAIVAEKISDNHFKIKTDKPNVEVSWQVAGVRQDPVANAYRIKDEVEKPAPEKGYYLTPEVYGQGKDKMLGYAQSSMHRMNAQSQNTKKLPVAIKPTAARKSNKR